MLTGIQWTFWAVGIGMQVLLLTALSSHGYWRKFPVLFAFVLVLLGTTSAEIVAKSVLSRSSYFTYYWLAELVRQSILFALVVSLASQAIRDTRSMNLVARWVPLAGALIWFGSVAIWYSESVNAWMTTVVRNLSFFTGVLTLFVWFAFVSLRNRDVQRLMIAGGLGLQMTGEAIGQAIRQMNISTSVSLGGSIFIVLAHFVCLFIWWRAFAPDPRVARTARL